MLLCYITKMKIIKNPNKENGLNILVETLKNKKIITDKEIEDTKKKLKLKHNKIKKIKKGIKKKK